MDAELGVSISETVQTTPGAHSVLVASSTQDHSGTENLRKQLADNSAEATRVANQLHDAQAMHSQHVLLEKAKDEKSRASAEQMQQQQLGLKEGVPTRSASTLIHQTVPMKIQSAREQGVVSEIKQQIDIATYGQNRPNIYSLCF